MFLLKEKMTDNGEWEEISFELKKVESSYHEPNFSFANEVKSRLLIGEYVIGSLKIEMAVMRLYGEKEDSVALCYTIGENRIDSHGVLRNNTGTGIPTDRSGNAIELSIKLPPNFYEWLASLERKMA